MRYFALAVDYDGTIATNGRVPADVTSALKRVSASGRCLIMVTGREVSDLLDHFPELDIFDLVVAENGALLYDPHTRDERPLADPAPPEFVKMLKDRGVENLRVGHSIVATWTPHETTILEAIRELGLEWHIVFNKGAVMALPTTVNKATGLVAALETFNLSPHNIVGVGDAENDQAFLSMCECSVAVANALPGVKERADHVTKADHGAGVVELIDMLLEDDLKSLDPCLSRHQIMLAWDGDSEDEYLVPPWDVSLLVTGSSGGGKSTAATGFVERLSEAGYQYCIIDPEGDYETFLHAIVLGDKHHAPNPDEVLDVIKSPERDVVINLLGVPLHDRPAYFGSLLPRLQELRTTTGRPHWIIVDEAHHLMPSTWNAAKLMLPQGLEGMLYITVHPDLMSPAALSTVDIVVSVGKSPEDGLTNFSEVTGMKIANPSPTELDPGHALVWDARRGESPFEVKIKFGTEDRKRHTRKYAEGDLGPDRSFYFRGPEEKLNIQAQNLMLFSQIGDGVDDETWDYHIQRHDYSTWFRDVIKDSSLAEKVEAIENEGLPADESRRAIREAIEEDYTLPASKSTGWVSEDPDHQTVAKR